jgi:molybdopterin-guanine dinucleotide biosynthesis protein A
VQGAGAIGAKVTPVLDAVVTAAGRLHPEDARHFGTDIKALITIGGRTLLATAIDALRGVPAIGRITVIGPSAAKDCGATVDKWIDERATGEENVLAGLASARAERAVFCASDLPFVMSEHISALIDTAATPDCAYPIFTREEFEREFSGARSSFATLADGAWTGGSVLVLKPAVLLRNARLIKQAFAARKSLVGLATLLGPGLALRYASGRLRIDDVRSRVASLTGASFEAVRGLHPALAMDCDERADFEYAKARLEKPDGKRGMVSEPSAG